MQPLLPSADKLNGDANFLFSRTLAPAHSAKTTSKWLSDHDITVLDWQIVVTPDTDWFSDPLDPQYSKTAHVRVSFYCGQPKAHLCNNHAV